MQHVVRFGSSLLHYQGEVVEVVRALASLHPRTEGMVPLWSPHPAGRSPPPRSREEKQGGQNLDPDTYLPWTLT